MLAVSPLSHMAMPANTPNTRYISFPPLSLNEGSTSHVTDFWLQLVNFLVFTFWTTHQHWMIPN